MVPVSHPAHSTWGIWQSWSYTDLLSYDNLIYHNLLVIKELGISTDPNFSHFRNFLMEPCTTHGHSTAKPTLIICIMVNMVPHIISFKTLIRPTFVIVPQSHKNHSPHPHPKLYNVDSYHVILLFKFSLT